MAFVDTNVLVYAFEREGSDRKRMARELVERLISQDRLCLSTQVLQELFVTLTRKGRKPSTFEQALECLEELSVWPVFLVNYAAIRRAATLSRDATLSFRDALIVVAASESGASHLYSEDLNHGQRILGVEIVNLFREVA